MLGFPLADPIIGLLIAASILVLLWGTVRSIGRRLMDGIDPELLERAEAALAGTPGVISVPRMQLRWVGHRLHGVASIQVADISLSAAEDIAHEAEHHLGHALPNLDDVVIRAVTTAPRPTPTTLR
jgi:divalent metal cation (Fe/Co/Zn/Cd) transporter